MKVTCPSCQTNYNIDDKRIPPGGAKIKCAKCQSMFPVKPGQAPVAAAPAAVPLPGVATLGKVTPPRAAAVPPKVAPPPGPASWDSDAPVPLPGGPSFEDDDIHEGATRVADVRALAGDWSDQTTRVDAPPAIPLPGAPPRVSPAAAAAPVSDPFGDATSWDTALRPGAQPAAVPLPGGGRHDAADVPIADSGDAIPLPGGGDPFGFDPPAPPPGDVPDASAEAFDFAPPAGDGAIPLPGAGGGFDPFGPSSDDAAPTGGDPYGYDAPPPPQADDGIFDVNAAMGGGAAPEGDGVSLPPPPEDDFSIDSSSPAEAIALPGNGAPLAPADDFSLDFNASDATEVAPAPAFEFVQQEQPPAPPADDGLGFDDLPAPAVTHPQAGAGFSFDDLPSPAAPAQAAPDFNLDDLPSPAAPPPPKDAFGFDDLPAPAAPAAAKDPFSFDDLPAPAAPAPVKGKQAAPAAAAAFSFDDLPAPAAPAADPFALDDLPAPAAPAPAADFSVDLGDLPAPAAPAAAAPAPAPQAGPADSAFNFDFAEIPAPPPPPPPAPPKAAPKASPKSAPAASPPPDLGADFGGIDFGVESGSPPAAASAPADDGLEFDPTGPAKPAADDLEADLSAPIPPRADKPADGLEMLSFIDDAAKGAKVAKGGTGKVRFHVRRRSGKVFGPFDEGVIIKMLEDGQLLGNEDVSTDSESWVAIGTVSAFSAAIQKLMEGPAGLPGAAPEGAAAQASSSASMERLKNLYEGRMAAVAVVDRSGDRAKLLKRLPLFVVAGLLVVGAGAGASLGFTRYGFFGLKMLAPAKVSAGTPEAVQFDNARKALLADTYKSYTESRTTAEKLLQVKEYPEVRAVWMQAVFYLNRRYASAGEAMAKARSSIEDIQLLGEKNAEVVKAIAGEKLAARDPDGALAVLLAAAPRQENADDLELQFLIAEAYASKGDNKNAKTTVEGILKRRQDSAKALHALGNLHQEAGEADEAAKSYGAALAADGNHVVSAVELAAVELLVRRDTDKGADAVKKALDEKTRSLLGPAEIARAHALNGVLLAMNFKPKEALAEFDEALKHDKESVFVQANMARVLLAQRDFERALPLFKEAAERQPKNLEYTDGYLSTLIAVGKMNDALELLGRANAQFPANARLAYLSGRVNDALGNSAQAESDYKRAIAGDEKLVEPHLWLARFYLRARRLSDARPQIEAAAKKAPESAQAQAGLGELALGEGKLDDAKAAFDRAVAADPNLADSYLGLSRVAYQKADLPTALTQIDKALELDKAIPDGRLQRGLIQWKMGQLDQALVELEQARAADPRSAEVPMVIGAVKLDKNDVAGAEVSIAASLSTDPSNPEAHYYLARVKNRRSEHTQAIEAMKNALDRAPNRAEFRLWMGRIYRDAKKLTEAVAEWQKTLQLDANNADALEALGAAYFERSEYDEAVEHYERSLKIDPSRKGVRAAIGDCHFTGGRYAEAIRSYQAALEEDAKLTSAYYKIGRSFTEQAQHQQAIGWYQKAAQFEPENPMPYWYLGFAHKEKGQKRDAIAAFKNYLSKKPDASDKKMIEDEIYDLEH